MRKRSKAKFGELAHRWLVPAAGSLFLIAGGAKLISVFGEAKRLKLPDSVLRLPWWLLMATAGMLEGIAGALCGLILYWAMDWHLEAKESCL